MSTVAATVLVLGVPIPPAGSRDDLRVRDPTSHRPVEDLAGSMAELAERAEVRRAAGVEHPQWPPPTDPRPGGPMAMTVKHEVDAAEQPSQQAGPPREVLLERQADPLAATLEPRLGR